MNGVVAAVVVVVVFVGVLIVAGIVIAFARGLADEWDARAERKRMDQR